MLWFTVWTVLVVGTLVGAFLLGRRLWRTGRALAHELGRSAERVGDAAAAAAARAAALPVPPVHPQVLDETGPLRADVQRLRQERADRAEVRAARHTATYARWRAYTR